MKLSDQRSLTNEDYSLKDDDWIAECLSLGPERSLKIPRISTSWDALCVLYLMSHLESHYWKTDEIHRAMAQKAYVSNYQGDWKLVQEILEQYPKTPKEFYYIFLKSKSPEEFFGNLVPRSRRLSYGIDNKKRDPHGPVLRPQRHRGYRDKGTLRPPHQPAVVPPLGEPHEDRRSHIGHPLLREERVKTLTGEDHLPNNLRKE